MSGSRAQEHSSPPPSDAGAVASRRGYKFQDHVAVHFILRMIADPDLANVECETADDIVLTWSDVPLGRPEYVQVKTADADSKWSQKEVCKRAIAGQPTSLIEKSLLCDSKRANARFRIVTQRGVNKSLACIEAELNRRVKNSSVESLGRKFAKKYSTQSANGHDLAYWTANTVWQAVGSMDALIAKNQQALARLAEQHGANPTHSHTVTIYENLLNWADAAASASRVTNPDDKIISRDGALERWSGHMASTTAAQRRTSKPYRVRTEQFFAELHHISEAEIRRALSGYDARYDQQRWRSKELAEYLADWLPELALKASELVEVQHLNMRLKRRGALNEIRRHRNIDPSRLLGEVLLHAVLRHHFQSEPIACKLFYNTLDGTKPFGNAHIVHRVDGDELWLGHSTVCDGSSYDAVVSTIVEEFERLADPEFLKAEREVIVTLREPHHLLPTSLEKAFERYAPIDDLLDVLSICVLVGYDSNVLAGGFNDGYRQKLVQEVSARYEEIKPRLPSSVATLRVHVFLIPTECVKTLTGHFLRAIEEA